MRRLSGATRLLCLLGPLTVGVLLVAARVVLPWAWSGPRLAWALSRPCLLKAVTGVPCPFCGGTRAVVFAAGGQWLASLAMNPLGVLLVAGGPLLALWLGLCAATGRDLGLSVADRFLSRRSTVPGFLGFVLALWVWKIVLWLALGV
ncbi:MAG: DUF2752 domain-containing protein [Planctomycetota bacterium]